MKVLVSACLLGVRCRYDASARYDGALVDALSGCVIVPICPEMQGGLPCPRLAGEIASDGRSVIDKKGRDITAAFERGAACALGIAQAYGCTDAVLKAKSPSCGCGAIYDGSFSGHLVRGDGITARLLKEHGIHVADEKHFVEACRRISEDSES